MAFGDYLKKKRKESGKTLREMASETGISNAHLSQMETGKIKEPNENTLQKISDYYGVSLDMLASLCANKQMKSRGPISLVTASDLLELAERRRAEGMLPKIVRDLIMATVDVEFLRIPVGDSIHLAGWDGRVSCKDTRSIFVPEGNSCWEMSKGGTVEGKATKDIKKREEDPLVIKPEETTYVCVTLRRFRNKDKWIKLQKKRNVWKDVQVVDAEDLEVWLESAPVIAIKLAKELGKIPIQGALPLQMFWDEWKHSTEPTINEKLLLEFGKSEKTREIFDFLENTKNLHYNINVENHNVGVAYIYSVISSLKDDSLRQSLLSRAIVVENTNAFRELIDNSNSLLLISICKGSVPVGKANSNDHQVLTVSEGFGNSDETIFKRLSHFSLTNYLENQKMERGQAARYASKSHGSLTLLKYLLSRDGEKQNPFWLSHEKISDIASLVLFGSWSSSCQYDKEFISEVSGIQYKNLEKMLKEISILKNSPLKIIGNEYIFHQEFALEYVKNFLSIEYVKKFIDYSSKLILCEYNDKYDLAKEERMFSNIYGKGLSSSNTLRKGIATSYAIMADRDFDPDIKFSIEKAIEKILRERTDWKYWASLRDILPLLAEANPNIFLNELSKICVSDNFVGIFKENSNIMIGGPSFTEILWALEACAWEGCHLKQVTEILIRMTKHEDVSSNYTNRPFNTLQSLYQIAWPQTNCSFDDRMSILEDLYTDYPEEIWDIWLTSVPPLRFYSTKNYQPRFREIEHHSTKVKTNGEVLDCAYEVWNRVKDILKKDINLWNEAFSLVFKWIDEQTAIDILDYMKEIDIEKMRPEKRVALWKNVEQQYARHSLFKTADWSFKGELLNALGKVYKNLEPKDRIERWSHLFKWHPDHPELDLSEYQGDKSEKKIEELQKKAMKEIFAQHGKSAIYNIISNIPELSTVNSPDAVVPSILARSYIDSLSDEKEMEGILCNFDYSESENHIRFYKSFVFLISGKKSLKWVDNVIKKNSVSDERKVEIYLSAPQNKEVWEVVECSNDNIKKCYWKETFEVWANNESECIWLCRKLLDHNKPWTALRAIEMAKTLRYSDKIPCELIVEVLQKMFQIRCDKKEIEYSKRFLNTDFKEFLDDLDRRKKIDQQTIATLEWNLIPFFRHDQQPVCLSREIEKKPQHFVTLLEWVYLRDGDKDAKNHENVLKEDRKRAMTLLSNYKRIPGMDESGKKIDENHLKNWVEKVRNLCKECDRVKIGDYVLGKMFACSPFDPADEYWPILAVRKIIEDCKSEDMKSGFFTGIYNSRGVVTKSPYEGGGKERKLAKKYSELSEKIEARWPHTAEVLRKISKEYESLGKFCDNNVEIGMYNED